MEKFNILIDDNIPLLPEILQGLGKIKTFQGRTLTNRDIIDFDADILIVRSTTIVDERLLKNTKVKIIATATSGSEHLDKNFLSANDIIYLDAIGSNALSVAEYCIFGILHWADKNEIDLVGKIIGIIGYGNVGRRLAVLARHIGLNVIINDPPLQEQKPDDIKNETHIDLNELIGYADILTTHTPLILDGKYSTYKLLNNENLKKLKPNTLLLHTSRGGVVDEKSWIKLAEDKKITAIVDVWENEPQVRNYAVECAFIATPHIAGHSYDAKIRGSLMLARKLSEILNIQIDTDILEERINENKLGYENMKIGEIYNYLKNEKNILETSDKLKELTLDNKLQSSFELIRKNYPMVREIFKDFLFKL